MSFFWLAVKDLLLIGRDKQAFLTLIMMPLLLIAILGAAFGNIMNEEGDVTLERFTVGVVNLDQGPLGKVLAKDVFAEGLSEQIRIKYYQKNELDKQIKNNKLTVGITIPENFTSALASGQGVEIKLSTDANPGVKSMIVQSVIEQFTQSVIVETEVNKLIVQKAIQAGMSVDEAIQANNQNAGLNQANKQSAKSFISESTVQSKNKPVGAFQYYAAAMGVMFLLMTVSAGVSSMIQEKEQEVYKRLLVSKLTFTNYLSGKMLGLVIISLIQAFIMIIGTNLLFGVDWGKSISGIVLVTVAYCICACGLGVLVGAFINKEKTFSVVSMLGTQIMAAIGGSMAPLYVFPDWAVLVGKFLPNGLTLQTYLELMTGASISDVLPEVAAVLGLSIVFFSIGIIRLSLERRGRYA